MADTRYELNAGVLAQSSGAIVTSDAAHIEERLLLGLRRNGLMVGLGHEGERLRLDLIGKFTRSAVPGFKELTAKFLEKGYSRMTLDMRGLKKLDGNGLAALAWLTVQAREKNGQILLTNLSPAVSRVVLMAHAHFVLEISDYDLAG